MIDEVENLRRVHQSRERVDAPSMKDTLGRQRVSQLAAQTEKRVRGGVLLASKARHRRQETLQGEKTQCGSQSGNLAKPQALGWAASGVLSPEGDARNVKWRANLKREAAFERTYDTRGGEKPRRVDPMSGTGMK
jgi:hypothetical protein